MSDSKAEGSDSDVPFIRYAATVRTSPADARGLALGGLYLNHPAAQGLPVGDESSNLKYRNLSLCVR